MKPPKKTENSPSPPPGSSLIRQLGLFDSAMIMMGIIIGSGIFLTSGIMAKSIPSAPLLLLAWLAGGLLTLAGALTYGELGAAMPQAGGQYVYLREAYGALAGFLFGWILFLVYMTGGIAGLALAFAEYFGGFFPAFSIQNMILSARIPFFGGALSYSLSAGQLVGVAVIAMLSLINVFGVRLGKSVQNVFTVLKIGTISAVVVFGLSMGNKIPVNWDLNPAGLSWSGLLIGFGAALVAVAWSFDGWNNVNFVAGEIKNPGRTLPRALILGTLGVTALYLLTNLVYLKAVPMPEFMGEVRIAETAVTSLFGVSCGAAVSALVVVSVFGSLNGSILAGPRVYYAMAKDGLFFKRAGRVHRRYRTPDSAIALQAVWASLLTLIGTFEQIFTFAMFMSIAFWVAAAAAVFRLRKKRPDMPRPYKTWGYPVVPWLFILASGGILVNTLIEKPVESLSGIALTAAGVPVYFWWKKKTPSIHKGEME
ncbi:MAG: APC family permease [Candidatus Aminicenantaceae bacterium]